MDQRDACLNFLQSCKDVLAVHRQEPLTARYCSRLWGLGKGNGLKSWPPQEIHTLSGVSCHLIQPLLCVVLPKLLQDPSWAVAQSPLPQKPDDPDVTGKP